MGAKATTASESGRSVLMTGATGCVGGRLAPLLLSRGYGVRACARNPRRLENRPSAGHANR